MSFRQFFRFSSKKVSTVVVLAAVWLVMSYVFALTSVREPVTSGIVRGSIETFFAILHLPNYLAYKFGSIIYAAPLTYVTGAIWWYLLACILEWFREVRSRGRG
ncbi:MAG: hypothetical protein AAB490_01680 [Patescibacteria group bacterium]